MIVLNAGAALYAADLASSLKQGVELAHDALHTGLAREKLEELGAFTAVFKVENEGGGYRRFWKTFWRARLRKSPSAALGSA